MKPVDRRTILKGGIALAFLQSDASAMRPQEGDFLVKMGDAAKKPLSPADIAINATQTMAWAMEPASTTVRNGSRLNQVLLIRFEGEKLSEETRQRAADGVVAYTAVCTHSGCEVGDWLNDEQVLFCECHSSKFDPKDGARVVDGPAPRSLPALPLKIADGKLVVAKTFTSRVGSE